MKSPVPILIERLLVDAPLTCRQIAAALNVSLRHAQEAVKYLHDGGRVYVAEWDALTRKTGGAMPIARYLAGDRRDARRPRPLTRLETVRRCRARKLSPERLLFTCVR